jgi:dihydroorotate dehydrogenase (NAD+) catalytic subunit
VTGKPKLAVALGRLRLKNPVLLASGVFGYGDEFWGLADYGKLGGLTLKTITLQPTPGNPPAARTVETPAGVVNSIGLENVGLEVFLQEKLPFARRHKTCLIASIAGERVSEFAELAAALDQAKGLSALELNISCPNVERGGMCFGVEPRAAARVVAAARKATRLPVIPKLTPNVTDIAEIARACEAAGADAVSLVNTFSAMVIDIRRRRPLHGGNFGGLSGPAIRPAAVLRVHQVARAVRIPVIGMGGIWNGNDALEFLIAGASAVAVGTALFADPAAGHRVLSEIERFLQEEGLPDLRRLIGSLELN